MAWAWLAVGTGAWAAGQAVWTFYEVVLDREVPFPSLADVGFLLFPLAAAVGLVVWLGTQSDQLAARGRDVLDGAIIAGSLLVLSWVTTLGSVVATGGDSWFPLTLSLAYPVGDLLLATLVLIALARGSGAERTTLAVLALGLGGLAVADSAYVYLVGLGRLLLGRPGQQRLGVRLPVRGRLRPDRTRRRRRRARDAAGAVRGGRRAEAVAAAADAALRAARPPPGWCCASTCSARPRPRPSTCCSGSALVVIVLSRQFLAMADNQRLLVALADARDQLEHQALHDALTGLANRVLFADRLDRALLQPDAEVSVLFCDIDDFKVVNDERGHEAGDQLLQHVASRLLDCVRVTDTVARLGGDEFAILLEDAADALEVADRVVTSIREPVEIGDRPVRTSISVGIAHHRGVPVVRQRHAAPRDAGAAATYPDPQRGRDRRHRAARGDRRPAAAARRHGDVRRQGGRQEPRRAGGRGRAGRRRLSGRVARRRRPLQRIL